ncbi:MAG: tRNA (N(6)-L-threonylcarbamoyladenosine(37)-C(2))-methylthiotransferase MtaB, partial [Acidobacteria bacterium]|nr:tRNA (N(6)-L-threonylcarbamoyladenosine(37)-C(2))-methylthiotransferase MtaB [Acidobacteriota bacterium]
MLCGETFYVHNFGCRAAQADGAALESALRARGLRPAAARSSADLVVLNTCTVTCAADEDARQAVRRAHRENPQARILVTGCYAQRAPKELASLPGVSWVVGNTHKHRIVELVQIAPSLPEYEQEAAASLPFHGQIFVSDILEQREFLAAPVEDSAHDRTRPNLKIQDGCNNRCSFCIIPSVRGHSRSAPADNVVEQVRGLGSRYCEVVLSGINLGRWGRDLEGRPRLAGLTRRLLEETEVARLRLSSVEPMDWSDELLELMASEPRLARHVHAPLQSGSDRILRRMHRRYRPGHYADRVLKARRLMPQAAIGADVMVGFPGETEFDFEATRQFVAGLPFTYLHVFTYSARPGTPAAEMPDQVPATVKRERNRILRELAAEKGQAFRSSLVGQTLSVVTLAMPLGATKLYLFGISVDQQFRTEYLTRLADSPALHDMTYQGLPPYYPPGWFWIGGRLAALTGTPAWEMYKPWSILSITAAIAVAFVLWKAMIRFETALVVTSAT